MENPINRSGLDAGGVNPRGRCALVTGAGSGIGRAHAFPLAAPRAEAAALDLDGDAAKRTAQDQARVHGISEDQVVRRIMLTEPAMKRLLDPEVVAVVAASLRSPRASFINGTSMVIDGGWTRR